MEAPEPPKEPRDVALERCAKSIHDFKVHKEFAKWCWIIFQGGAIVLAGHGGKTGHALYHCFYWRWGPTPSAFLR